MGPIGLLGLGLWVPIRAQWSNTSSETNLFEQTANAPKLTNAFVLNNLLAEGFLKILSLVIGHELV